MKNIKSIKNELWKAFYDEAQCGECYDNSDATTYANYMLYDYLCEGKNVTSTKKLYDNAFDYFYQVNYDNLVDNNVDDEWSKQDIECMASEFTYEFLDSIFLLEKEVVK